MKIKDLRRGDFFQFQRQRKGDIYQVVDPATSQYALVGRFVNGVPGPLPEGAARYEATEPDRSVKSVRIFDQAFDRTSWEVV